MEWRSVIPPQKYNNEGGLIFFIYDHLEGQARNKVGSRATSERDTPNKILKIVQDLFQDANNIAQIQQQFFQRGDPKIRWIIVALILDFIEACW